MGISAMTRTGMDEILKKIRKILNKLPNNMDSPSPKKIGISSNKRLVTIDEFSIEPLSELSNQRTFIVRGEAVEKFVQMTKFECCDSVYRLRKVLEVSGIIESLRTLGLIEGDMILIGKLMMKWTYKQPDLMI